MSRLAPGRHPITRGLLLPFVTLVVTLAPAVALAQIEFDRRVISRGRVNAAYAANALLSCSDADARCPAIRAGEQIVQNTQLDVRFVDADPLVLGDRDGDGIDDTLNSSAAVLELPPGSQVEAAYLYVGGIWKATNLDQCGPSRQVVEAERTQILFSPPDMDAYLPLDGVLLGDDNQTVGSGYATLYDVTDLVTGPGEYWVADGAFIEGECAGGGWALAVVYASEGEPLRAVTLFDGFALINSNTQVTVVADGLFVPPIGDVNAEIALLAVEGDRNLSGDQASIDDVLLQNGANPVDDFFNGTISRDGETVLTRTPAYDNNIAFDFDILQTTNLLQNDSTEAIIEVLTSADIIKAFFIGFTVDLFVPDLVVQKTVTNLTADRGGDPVETLPGDTVRYTVTVTAPADNNDVAAGVVVRDPLPAGLEYVEGSVMVRAPGAADFVAAGAQADYDAATGLLTVRIGTGADGESGGTLAPGESAAMRFEAVIAPDDDAVTIENVARASYYPETAGPDVDLTAVSDAVLDEDGLQPTEVVVDRCGNGERTADEACDDGNEADGDGCSSACTFEPGFACNGGDFRALDVDVIPSGRIDPVWTLSDDRRVLLQEVNSRPTHYTTSLPLTDRYRARFRVGVQTTTDNDFFGWSIGAGEDPLSRPGPEYLLFTWKQEDQAIRRGNGPAGLKASRVIPPVGSGELWTRQGDVIPLADAATLGATGWGDETDYIVEIEASADRVVVWVDGVVQFDLAGPGLPTGNLGFYAYSQEQVRFELLGPIGLSVCDTDTDGDGIGDRIDADADDDGIPDIDEGRGVDVSRDSDGDGVPDYADPDRPRFVDANGDGVDDRYDVDGDGIPNHLDLDADGDGLSDVIEGGGVDADGDGLADGPDDDGDGLRAPSDRDDGNREIRTTTYPLPDSDDDGRPDFLDPLDAVTVCGNGVREESEACDDGNGADGDGCDSACSVEPGFLCRNVRFQFTGIDTLGGTLQDPLWEIDADATVVTQRRNARASHYATNLPILEDRPVRFLVGARTARDDDWIGWTVGAAPRPFSAPDGDFLIFSWKQIDQAVARGNGPRGLRAARVQPGADRIDLWTYTQEVSVVAEANTLANTGWTDNFDHLVEIVWTGGRLEVYVDGQLEFDLAQPDAPGTLGLYNYSQSRFRAELLNPTRLSACERIDSDGDGVFDLADLDDDDDGIPDAIECVDRSVGDRLYLTDGGFEVPQGAGDTADDLFPGWDADDDTITLVGGAFEGAQAARVGAGDAVWQDLDTTAGQTIEWRVAHRGDGNDAEAELRIGPPEDPQRVQIMAAEAADGYRIYTGRYAVPPGQPVTRIMLVATSGPGVFDGVVAVPMCTRDTDRDGVVNSLDRDADGDGLLDSIEAGHGADGNLDGVIDSARGPNGLGNAVETEFESGVIDYVPADGDENGVYDFLEPPNDGDRDGDGLSDAAEGVLGTDPDDADTDDDGINDGDEVRGTGPLVPWAPTDPLDPDTDGDGILDGTETGVTGDDVGPDTDPAVFVPDADPTTTTDPNDPDTDGDELDDGEEDANHNGRVDDGETDPNVPNGRIDSDGDGLSDDQEADLGTDPDDRDTDDDGISDGDEVRGQGPLVGFGPTDPTNADTDGDGLDDGLEAGIDAADPLDTDPDVFRPDADPATTTDPTRADTDGDGIDDGIEDRDRNGALDAGETDPNDPDSDGDGIADGIEDTDRDGFFDDGETDPTNADTDGDGLDDGVEDSDVDGMLDPGETDPRRADTDGDGLADGIEVAGETDPTDADTDDDGLADGAEDANQDGTIDPGETDPADRDTDDDGLTDGVERGIVDPVADPDGDGPLRGTDPARFVPDADPATTTDPNDPDTDGGTVADGDEDQNLNGRIDAGERDPNDPADDVVPGDRDGDGVPNNVENQIGTDPDDPDSDDDGLSDGVEIGPDLVYTPGEDTDPLDPDTDDDGLLDGVEDADQNGEFGPGETDPLDDDTDDDGLLDGAEDTNGDGIVDDGETDPRNPDSDGDGLGDGLEATTGTDPLDPDTDGDGLDDGAEDRDRDGEVDDGETDPRDADSDDDGLADGAEDLDGDGELDRDETDPLDFDTDDDGLSDGVERGVAEPVADPDGDGPLLGTDPDVFVPDLAPETTTDPRDVDTDDGTVSDGDEDRNGNGRIDDGETDPNDGRDDRLNDDDDDDGLTNGQEDVLGTDPNDPDTDDDGIDDGDEVTIGTDPLDADSDDDGLVDGAEDLGGDGVIGDEETDPLDADTDDDGVQDGTEVGIVVPVPDPDGDGPVSGTDLAVFVPDADPTTTTDPRDADTDDGTVSDGDEDTNGNGRVDAGETDPNDPSDDLDNQDDDGDGLTNGAEDDLGTDPNDPDTDDDGIDDGDEVRNGTDPLDADSDDDGLTDGAEDANADGVLDDGETDPNDPDTDGDGIQDGTERGVTDPIADLDGDGPLRGTDVEVFVPDADPATTTDPRDADTDDGTVDDGVEDQNRNGAIDPGETDPNDPSDDVPVVDSDGDGLPDDVEDELGTDPQNPDTDGDGIGDGDEVRNGTDPLDADSDDDGLTDGAEDANADGVLDDGETDPNDPDTDGDGIQDGTERGVTDPIADLDGDGPLRGTDVEVFVPDADPATTTDPRDADTDDGTVPDGDEDTNGNGAIDPGETDPNDPADDVAPVDSDGDGLPDDVEDDLGTDPNDPDTDDDGIGDGDEVRNGTDPLDVDSDDDGLSDGAEDLNADGVLDDGETDPALPDTDGDGIQDGTERGVIDAIPDPDGDGPLRGTDVEVFVPDADPATTTDPRDADTDDGTVDDGVEDQNRNGAIDPGETDPNDPSDDVPVVDSDGDGLPDDVEDELGTDPQNPDTDGDGIGDGDEVRNGTDPLDADSDDDGLTDGAEDANADGVLDDGETDPNDPDTDGDGIQDGTERGVTDPIADLDGDGPLRGTDVEVFVPDADPATTTDPRDADTDDGTVDDGVEDQNRNGAIDPGETDPNDPSDDVPVLDSDGDGIPDDVEVVIGTDPNDADSDDDGLSDGAEDQDGDGVLDDGETDPLDADTDDDGVQDGTERGVTGDDVGPDTDLDVFVPDADPATTTDPRDTDTDDGGVTDGGEDANGNGAIDAGETDPNDPADDMPIDSDGDGIPDEREPYYGTDPNNPDTDGDGIPDGPEVMDGTDPTNPDTDGDGASDGVEDREGTDPLDRDTDDDGLLDGDELERGTSPVLPDSDDDGIFDGTEVGVTDDDLDPDTDVELGNFVPDADPETTTDPTDPDTDGGSVEDGDEDVNGNGRIDDGETDPNDPRDDVVMPGDMGPTDMGVDDMGPDDMGADMQPEDDMGPGEDMMPGDDMAIDDMGVIDDDMEVDDDMGVIDTDMALDGDGGLLADGEHIEGGQLFGCDTAPGTGGSAGWLAALFGLLLGLLFVGRRRRRAGAMMGGALIAAGLLAASPRVEAQERFDLQQFSPAPDIKLHGLRLLSARPRVAPEWSVGVLADHAQNLLVIENADGERQRVLVDYQTYVHLIAAAAFTERLEVGLDLPILVASEGELIEGGAGFGDVRLQGRAVLLTAEEPDDRTGSSLALAVDVYLPTGDDTEFTGGGWRVEPRLAYTHAFTQNFRLRANVGYQVRDKVVFENIEVDDMLTYGIGFEIPVGDHVALLPEVSGGAVILADEIDAEELPLEAMLGLKLLPNENWSILLGGGTGALPGFGIPDWRVLLGVAFTQAPTVIVEKAPEDRDNDGLLNDVDGCPDQPEDIDGFQDEDGCPDPDNDGDGILDVDDKCPLEPEDADGFEDADGCPDPDNDQDGVLDAADACPNQPEDIDGFEDEDGCPDPDNDQDGILDVNDRCPMQPENINDHEDDDGCPDNKQIKVSCDRIELAEVIYFETDKAAIQPRSFELLDALVKILAQYPELKKISIEGHTDSRGSDTYNLDLSSRRVESVRDWLVGKGIATERLVFKGFGESKPIASNDTAEGRAQNRRVEFRIVEADTRPGCPAGTQATPTEAEVAPQVP